MNTDNQTGGRAMTYKALRKFKADVEAYSRRIKGTGEPPLVTEIKRQTRLLSARNIQRIANQ